jgi:DNA replication protein DnaC
MLNNPTMERLSLMRLVAMAMAWQEQQKDVKMSKVAFDERFGFLVDAEWTHRENRRIGRILKNAKLRINQACIEDIDYTENRHLDRSVIRQLATCRWVDEHHNIVIEGATGTGKTYVSCALGQMACRRGHRVLYRRAPRLLDELRLARAAGEYAKELKRLSRIDVLIIDDWAIAPLQVPERQDVLEVLEDRHDLRSTIIASQLPAKAWHAYIGDQTVADAICDRVLHNAHRLVLKGPSRRKEKVKEEQ